MRPSIHMPRSRFDLSYSYKTTFNEGDLIPCYLQEVYPGDSFKCKTSSVVRTSVPFLRPIMDNLFLDTYYFFVPSRLVYTDFSKVLGENDEAWDDNYSDPGVPLVKLGASVPVGSLADYFGLPTGTLGDAGLKVSAIPFRAYALIYNEWFRNESTQDTVYINKGLDVTLPTINGNDFGPSNIYGKPAKVNKFKDYFTACLPEPQKGDAVDIPLVGLSNGWAPVVGQSSVWPSTYMINSSVVNVANNAGVTLTTTNPLGVGAGSLAFGSGSFSPIDVVKFNNLGADLRDVNAGNVNDLRFAFALQRALEKDARVGTRYQEYIYGHFGVISPDARLQRPEFLGGNRTPLNISQVANTTDLGGDQGQVAGMSLTNGFSGFGKGFTEHGFIIGVCCVRQKHTYQMNIEKFWMRKNRYDFYDPAFAFIGEQPVYKSEIWGCTTTPDAVFGYNEAYADLRFKFGKITGQLRTSSNSGLDIWHLGDSYASNPVLNGTFVKETNVFLDRTLSAQSSVVDNFILDMYHKVSAVRVLPTFGIPGLIDHA